MFYLFTVKAVLFQRNLMSQINPLQKIKPENFISDLQRQGANSFNLENKNCQIFHLEVFPHIFSQPLGYSTTLSLGGLPSVGVLLFHLLYIPSWLCTCIYNLNIWKYSLFYYDFIFLPTMQFFQCLDMRNRFIIK